MPKLSPKDQFEVVELATGARMAHTRTGEVMSTTLFDSTADAQAWMRLKSITTSTHTVQPARI